MLHHRPLPPLPHAHEIEPADVSPPPVPRQPAGGHPRQDHSLAEAHRLRRRPAADASPALHLDEGDDPVPPGHEVQVVPAEAEAVRLDPPAAGREIGQRRQLPAETAAVAAVAPLGDGDETLSGWHGGEDGAAAPGERDRFGARGTLTARAVPPLRRGIPYLSGSWGRPMRWRGGSGGRGISCVSSRSCPGSDTCRRTTWRTCTPGSATTIGRWTAWRPTPSGRARSTASKGRSVHAAPLAPQVHGPAEEDEPVLSPAGVYEQYSSTCSIPMRTSRGLLPFCGPRIPASSS